MNLREEPPAGKVLDCQPDGVLLRDTGETQETGDGAWVRVATPAGVQGWASAAYLER